jgi:hypothetical protein
LEAWSNDEKDKHYSTFSSKGIRLIIKTTLLLEFLKATDQCLILDSGIKRHVDRREHYEYYPEYTRRTLG